MENFQYIIKQVYANLEKTNKQIYSFIMQWMQHEIKKYT